MNIEEKLTASIISAINMLYGQEVPAKMVQLQKTKKEFEGHLTLVVFPFLKMSKKGPEQTAQEIGAYLCQNAPELISAYNAVKGFLNLTIASDCWIELLNSIQAQPEYGIEKATENSPLVMIEYSSPNTNKPLHLGHVRNNLLGNALANVMAANGNKVVKTNIVNDRGIHICKSMLAWLKYGNGETPESSGKKGDHLIGDYYVAFDKHYKAEVKELMAQYQAEGMNEEEAKAKAEAESPLMQEAREMLRKWEANDPEIRALWKKMNDWVYAGFDETYKMMGVGFDKIYYESNTYLAVKGDVNALGQLPDTMSLFLGNNNQVGSFLKLIHHFQHISCEEGTVFEMITLCIFICSYNRFFNQFNPYHLFRTCFSHNLPNRTCATVQVENRLICHISGKFLYNGIKLFRAGGIRLEEGIYRNLKFQIKQLFHKEISAIEQAHFVAFDHIRQSIIHRMQNTTDRAVQFQSEQHILKFLHGKGNLRGSHQID